MTPQLAAAALQFLARLGRRNPAQDQVLPEEYGTYLQVMQALKDEASEPPAQPSGDAAAGH